MNDVRLILASSSPRRRQLLALGGWQFHLCSPWVDESPLPYESPSLYALRVAESKARVGACSDASEGELIIGADTIVVDSLSPQGGSPTADAEPRAILGKPTDAQEAVCMLRRLRQRTHQVMTAVAVYDPSSKRLCSALCVTSVTMRPYSDAEIERYVASGDPLDKAGAYAIQHPGFNPVASIQGCFANVVGLPLCTLNRLLSGFGLDPPRPLPAECAHETCPFCQELIQAGV